MKRRVVFGLFLGGFLSFFILIFKFIPFFSSMVSKVAIVSSKLNLREPLNVLPCFNFLKNSPKILTESESKNFEAEPGPGPNLEKEEEIKIQPPKENNLTQSEKPQNLNPLKEGEGLIVRKQYKAGTGKNIVKIADNAFVNNMTTLPNNVVCEANGKKPAFVLENRNNPQVLLIHSHTTECYEPEEKAVYSKNSKTRSTNLEETVVKVGDEIKKSLEAAGIKVIHDRNVYDNPDYIGAYNKSGQAIKNILAKNPSVKIVLDVHRDSLVNEKTKEKIAPVLEIAGKKAAQIMIITGCDNGTNHYPNFLQNLSFACLIQRQLGKDFPNFARPIAFKYKLYNQNLTPGTLLIEIGSECNSLDEAKYAGDLFGKSLANALNTLWKKTK